MTTRKDVERYIADHIHLIDNGTTFSNNNLNLKQRAKCYFFAHRNGNHVVRAKLVEELYELIEALESGYGVASEKADVLIMLAQHTIIEQDGKDVQEAVEYKVARQEMRFREEDEDEAYNKL